MGLISNQRKNINITNLGINKGLSKDYQGAISDFNKSIEIDPKYGGAYLNRGIARELAKDLQGACDDWRKAADLGEENAAEWVKEQC